MSVYKALTWHIQLVTIKQSQVKNREDQLTSFSQRIITVHHQMANTLVVH